MRKKEYKYSKCVLACRNIRFCSFCFSLALVSMGKGLPVVHIEGMSGKQHVKTKQPIPVTCGPTPIEVLEVKERNKKQCLHARVKLCMPTTSSWMHGVCLCTIETKQGAMHMHSLFGDSLCFHSPPQSGNL